MRTPSGVRIFLILGEKFIFKIKIALLKFKSYHTP